MLAYSLRDHRTPLAATLKPFAPTRFSPFSCRDRSGSPFEKVTRAYCRVGGTDKGKTPAWLGVLTYLDGVITGAYPCLKRTWLDRLVEADI